MPNRGRYSKWCKRCGRERVDGETFSARGKCMDCSHGRVVGNIHSMVDHTGPAFLAWRRRVAASVGGVLLEDLESEPDDAAA